MTETNSTPTRKPESDNLLVFPKTGADGPDRLSRLGDGVSDKPGVALSAAESDGHEIEDRLATTEKHVNERTRDLNRLKISLEYVRRELYSLISLTAMLSFSQIDLGSGQDGDVQIDGYMVADVFSQIRDRLSVVLDSLDEETNRF